MAGATSSSKTLKLYLNTYLNMKNFIYGILLSLIFALPDTIMAQHQDISERPEIYKANEPLDADSNTVLGAFKSNSL